MAEIDNLISKAKRRAAAMSVVLAFLIATKRKELNRVRFDRARAAFVIDGQVVPIAVIRLQLNQLEAAMARTMDLYAARLESGTWTLDEWRDAMESLIRESHLMFAALAAGGIAAAALMPITKTRADRDVRYLQGFKRDIAARRVSDYQQIKRRARSYLRSAYVTYSHVEMQLHKAAGYTEAKRIRRAKESCESCIKYSYRWMDINLMPPIGTLKCKQYCLCYILYR